MIEYYKKHLQLINAQFEPIKHDDAMVADVYRIIKPDTTQLILKICVREKDYLRENYYLTLLADKIPVPKIIATVKPTPDIPGAILMECLPGNIVSLHELTASLAYEMGRVLALIHSNRTEQYGDLTKPSTLTSDPLLYFSQKFEEHFNECTEHLPQELLQKCQDYYHTHEMLLNSVDGPCITHLDYRPGNIVAYNGKLQGVIDWSTGRSGFAQEDFIFIEYDNAQNQAHKKDFINGYASTRPVPDYKELIKLLSINKALGTLGFLLKKDRLKKYPKLYTYHRTFLENSFK